MKRIIEKIIAFTFNLIDPLFFTKKYLVFSCRGAKDYADNSKALFEYFISKNDEDVFFFTKKKSVLNKIPVNAIYAYSLKGILVLLRSKTLIFTHGSADFFPYTPNTHKNRRFINLFHAIAVKKVGHNNIKLNISESLKWDNFVVSSKFERDFIQEQYTLHKEKILILGQPRNDLLFWSKKIREISPEKKLYLYAPTFRDDRITQLFPFEDQNLSVLDKYLEKNNCQIMIRLHINDECYYSNNQSFENFQNIFMAGSDIYPDVNLILHEFDGLITDYSSVAIDFLLMDKPIAYIPYDYDFYLATRGFSFDFFSHIAGPIISSQQELHSFLESETDTFKDKRLSLTRLFFQDRNGKSAERLYQFIKSL